jgi:hypothetical protein
LRLGPREIRGVECEFRVGRRESGGGLFYVPAQGCEAGSKINKRVARQFLVPELLCDGFDRVKPVKRAVRLLVTQRPQRCHLGVTGDPGVLLHDRRRSPGANDKNVERQRVPGGLKLAFGRRLDQTRPVGDGQTWPSHRCRSTTGLPRDRRGSPFWNPP